MVKLSGAEWKRYIADSDPVFWPEGSYMDDQVVLVDGVDENTVAEKDITDDAKVTLESGVWVRGRQHEGTSLEAHFKRWRKAQSTVTLTVEVRKENADALRAAITAAGGKIK